MHNTPCIKDIKDDFDKTLSASEQITDCNFRMGVIASFVNAVLNIFAPML